MEKKGKLKDEGIALDFQVGDEAVEIINVKSFFSLPCPLSVFSPTTEGTYPVLLFFHGFCLQPDCYNSLLLHISSHRYIVIAPKFSLMTSRCEVKKAKKIVKWLSSNKLDKFLPEKVLPDLLKVGISGHSRGGKTAFALALAYGSGSKRGSTTSGRENLEKHPPFKFSALLGIDPVATRSSCLCSPNILHFIPYSFNHSVPVAVIGTGLSNQRAYGLCPPGAPNGVNHAEFYNESKPPCYYFLARDYGHADILDDRNRMTTLMGIIMKNGQKGTKDTLRRTVGGLFVAFLKAYLEGQADDLINIVESPDIRCPIKLDPVISIED